MASTLTPFPASLLHPTPAGRYPTLLQTGAPDVVYSFTPPADMAVDISTCGSLYDTKVYVFEDPDNLQVRQALLGEMCLPAGCAVRLGRGVALKRSGSTCWHAPVAGVCPPPLPSLPCRTSPGVSRMWLVSACTARRHPHLHLTPCR